MRNCLLIAAIAVAAGCGKTPAPESHPVAPPMATQQDGSPQQTAGAADFALTDLDGKVHRLSDYRGRFVVLEWVNHECPYVKKHYESGNMQRLQKSAADSGVAWLSICSSAPGKQGNLPAETWKELIAAKGAAPTAMLLDQDGKTGMAYGARTTPHMFVLDPAGMIIYKGAIDDRPTTDREHVTSARNHVAAALEEALAGQPVSISVSEPYGCSIKYQEG